MGLFERLTGTSIDGIPIGKLSEQTARVISIRDHLQRLLNTPLGSLPNRQYGFPLFPDIHTKVPENVQVIEKTLLDTIRENDLRVKKTVIAHWDIEEKTSTLFCIAVLTLAAEEVCRFRILLGGTGNIRVEMHRDGRGAKS